MSLSTFSSIDRYSSLVPLIDFRTGYEKDYVDQFYGDNNYHDFDYDGNDDEEEEKDDNDDDFAGKPDQFRLLYKSNFETQVNTVSTFRIPKKQLY